MVIIVAVFASIAVAVVVTCSIRSSSKRLTEARPERAAADLWLHRSWRRVDGALIRGQIKRDALRLRREVREAMDRTEE